jgi:hypothetical protein
MAVSPEGIRGVDAEYRPPQNRCQIAFWIGDRDDEMTHDVNDLIGMRGWWAGCNGGGGHRRVRWAEEIMREIEERWPVKK